MRPGDDVQRHSPDSGEKLSVRQHSLMRLGMTHVTWAAHQVATFAYESAGTTALRAGTLQQLFQ